MDILIYGTTIKKSKGRVILEFRRMVTFGGGGSAMRKGHTVAQWGPSKYSTPSLSWRK